MCLDHFQNILPLRDLHRKNTLNKLLETNFKYKIMNNLYHRLSHIPPQGFILLMNITFGFPLTKNNKIRVKIQYSAKFQITCFKKRLNGCYFNKSEHASKLEH
jgi:hypothetical protein